MQYPLVIVRWGDAYGGAHTATYEHEMAVGHKPLLIETIGWLLRDDEAGVSLFNEKYKDEDETVWRGRSFIPRGMVRSVVPYNLTKIRKPKTENPA